MNARFQLDDFSLVKLAIDFNRSRRDGKLVEPTQHSLSFDFELDVHTEEPDRYRMLFKMKFAEVADDQQTSGYRVKADIVGFLRVDQDMAEEERAKLVPQNGVSVLYGLLRGIVANSTGVFPGGKLVLPTVMPQEIVRQVYESEKEQEEDLEQTSKS